MVLPQYQSIAPFLPAFFQLRQKRNKVTITKRWFTKEAYDQIASILGGTNWAPMATLKCEESTEFLQNKIIETLDIFAPVEMKTIKLKVENQWLTTGIIISLATSNKLYRRASKRKNPN